jgi:hypothetical protein
VSFCQCQENTEAHFSSAVVVEKGSIVFFALLDEAAQQDASWTTPEMVSISM